MNSNLFQFCRIHVPEKPEKKDTEIVESIENNQTSKMNISKKKILSNLNQDESKSTIKLKKDIPQLEKSISNIDLNSCSLDTNSRIDKRIENLDIIMESMHLLSDPANNASLNSYPAMNNLNTKKKHYSNKNTLDIISNNKLPSQPKINQGIKENSEAMILPHNASRGVQSLSKYEVIKKIEVNINNYKKIFEDNLKKSMIDLLKKVKHKPEKSKTKSGKSKEELHPSGKYYQLNPEEYRGDNIFWNLKKVFFDASLLVYEDMSSQDDSIESLLFNYYASYLNNEIFKYVSNFKSSGERILSEYNLTNPRNELLLSMNGICSSYRSSVQVPFLNYIKSEDLKDKIKKNVFKIIKAITPNDNLDLKEIEIWNNSKINMNEFLNKRKSKYHSKLIDDYNELLKEKFMLLSYNEKIRYINENIHYLLPGIETFNIRTNNLKNIS